MLAQRQIGHGVAPLLRTSPRCPARLAPAARPQRSHQARGVSTVVAAQKVSDLPANLKKIVGAFQMVPDPMARYKQLLFYATKLSPLPAADHSPANKVEGCVSQVWVVPELRDDGKIYWRADSDSQLTKGLAALLVTGLSGCTPAEILSLEPDFIEMLGLKQSLTPSRNNGFLNMFKLMQRKTLEVVAAAGGKVSPSASVPATNGNGNGNGASAAAPVAAPAAAAAPAPAAPPPAPAPAQPAASTSAPASTTPMRDSMARKITEALQPTRLSVLDESAQHAGHAHMMSAKPGKAGAGETHFRVEVVSPAFEGLTQVKRQRMIYALLDQEFAGGLHALALVTRTPEEDAKA
ncbi:hypothetical protein HYH03_010923 [Edaphochlamys debaryana]|uniref:Fe-S metabolism associated domain-containing protein n=1 Tax=Edaphochlamys debaryana TaxID=47281 RepID=A0A835XV55_9CHLO|nr:hypothetical protein HYH03_010923 [Edaphochlamys debaryana]|eukprot:KAG2490773.1 hypothetical protein HYH03_010923 [Edaphochlamys debaryana]